MRKKVLLKTKMYFFLVVFWHLYFTKSMYLVVAPLVQRAGIISPTKILRVHRFEYTVTPLVTIGLTRPPVDVVSLLVTFHPPPGPLADIVTQSNPVEYSLDEIDWNNVSDNNIRAFISHFELFNEDWVGIENAGNRVIIIYSESMSWVGGADWDSIFLGGAWKL